METMSARCMDGSDGLTSFLLLKKRMFWRFSVFVVADSVLLVVLLYSHDRIAKKNAPTINWEHALASGSSLLARSVTLRMSDEGAAFCCCLFGSLSRKLSSCFRSDAGKFPSSPNLGS